METSSGETSVVDAMEALGKKYEINHKCANANTKHFLTKLSLEYIDLNGEEHTITEGNAPSAMLEYTDPNFQDRNELSCSGSGGSGKFETKFKGVNAVVIYTAQQPTFTVNFRTRI